MCPWALRWRHEKTPQQSFPQIHQLHTDTVFNTDTPPHTHTPTSHLSLNTFTDTQTHRHTHPPTLPLSLSAPQRLPSAFISSLSKASSSTLRPQASACLILPVISVCFFSSARSWRKYGKNQVVGSLFSTENTVCPPN